MVLFVFLPLHGVIHSAVLSRVLLYGRELYDNRCWRRRWRQQIGRISSRLPRHPIGRPGVRGGFLALFVASAVGAKTALAGQRPRWLSGSGAYPNATQPVSSLGSPSGVLSAPASSLSRQPSKADLRGAPTRRRRRSPGRSSSVGRERSQGSHQAPPRNSRPHASPRGPTPSEGQACEIPGRRPAPSAHRSLRRPHDADDAHLTKRASSAS